MIQLVAALAFAQGQGHKCFIITRFTTHTQRLKNISLGTFIIICYTEQKWLVASWTHKLYWCIWLILGLISYAHAVAVSLNLSKHIFLPQSPSSLLTSFVLFWFRFWSSSIDSLVSLLLCPQCSWYRSSSGLDYILGGLSKHTFSGLHSHLGPLQFTWLCWFSSLCGLFSLQLLFLVSF